MPSSLFQRRMPRTAAALGAALFALIGPAFAAPAGPVTTLPGHVPVAAVAQARLVGAVSASQPVGLALTLPLRNQAALADLLRRMYDPKDPLYGQSLTPAQFTAAYGPTQADYDRVAAFAQSQGLTVSGTSPGRTVLDVSGTAAQVENAFGVKLNTYQSAADGRVFYAPNVNPAVPASLAGVLNGVVGLDNAVVPHPLGHIVSQPNRFAMPVAENFQLPAPFVANKGNGLTPTDIKSLYNLSGLTQDGTGQTLAVFELDGYAPADIAQYENTFGLRHVPLTNVRIDGYNGALGGGQGEVTLDIELQIALAPGASGIIVYEAPATVQGIVDLYAKIATDGLAQEISTSWGLDERVGTAVLTAENADFMQMAAQHQSMFAASGDGGAYGGGDTNLILNDPGSQPFVTGVGGTDITIGPTGNYVSERAWGDPADLGRGPKGTGGGGGISAVWPIPSYQAGVAGSAASLGSTTMRNDPDVSLYGDYDTGGYLIFLGGAAAVYNGTSAASPLWSAYAALINQQRLVGGQSLLGFMNPLLYSLYNTSDYANDFHDVVGANNLFYPAVTGYDDATGLGSFNGANLFSSVTIPPIPNAPRALKAHDGSTSVGLTWTAGTGSTPTGYNLYRGTASGAETLYRSSLTSTSYTDSAVTVGTHYYYKVTAFNTTGEGPRSNETIGTAEATTTVVSSVGNGTVNINNGGFENGLSPSAAPWVATAGVIDNSTQDGAKPEPSHVGNWKAWLDGYGMTHTDTLTLNPGLLTIPATVNVGTLSFYLHVDTDERSRTVPYDTLQVQVRDLSGNVLGVAATYSNIDAVSGYALKTVDLSPYLGQPCQIVLVGKEDSSLQTSFVLDDFNLSYR